MQEFCMGQFGWKKNYPVTNREIAAVMPFYVSVFGHFYCGPEYFTRRDQYEACLLFYTVRGCGWLEYEGKQIEIPENCLAVIDCRNYQHYKTLGEEWEFYWVHFDGRCAVDLVSFLNKNGVAVIQGGAQLDFSARMAELQRLNQSDDQNRELHISEWLHRLLCQMAELSERPAEMKKYQPLKPDIDKVIDWMHHHYHQEIAVEELARIAKMSKYHFIRVFRTLTGDTPYHYLLRYRIDRSKQLLLDTHFSIQEIAEQTGFSSAKNYIACFKENTGMTPGKFRETMSL